MLEIRNKKILVLAPHTDDMEFGCGATVAKLIEEGNDVHCIAFSACRHSQLVEYQNDILRVEIKAAVQILGMPLENLHLKEYDVRTFSFHRQEILQDIIAVREEIQPDIIFMPVLNDLHQDHQTIATEGLRAFKHKTIFCYEMLWNNLTFNTTCFFSLTKEQVDKKVEALKEYKSQSHRPYASEEFLRAHIISRGVQVGTKYAECFEVLRLNIK